MHLLLDNTGLHRASLTLSVPSTQPVSLSDALALLHLAEHIMFSEGIICSTFEIERVRLETEAALRYFKQEGFTAIPGGQTLVRQEDFTELDYARACTDALPRIEEDLFMLTKEKSLSHATRLANFSTQPTGITIPALLKWLTKSSDRAERRSRLDVALAQKARGAYDYVIATSDPIYHYVRQLARQLRASKHFDLAMLLDVVFRVVINQKLAELRKCIYTPAPQRALITHELDRLFRHALARALQEAVRARQGFASRLITRIAASERLPLPVLAMHFLKRLAPKSPHHVLEAARKLRDTDDVAELRGWLSRWDRLHASSDVDQRAKAQQELSRLLNRVDLLDRQINVFSVLRPEIRQEIDGRATIGLDIAGLAEPAQKILAKCSRHSVFLAFVKR